MSSQRIKTTYDDGFEAWEPLFQSKERKTNLLGWKTMFCIAVVFALGAAFGAALVQINATTNKELAKIANIERELKVAAALQNAEITDIVVSHSADGTLIATWKENDANCEAPVLSESPETGLWNTGDAKCTSSSSGIKPQYGG